jgi:dihydroflavonol-4-reductase
MPKRVLVLGAAGFLGEHIVNQLAAADINVIAAVRVGSAFAFASPRVQVAHGDFHDSAFVRSLLDQVDAAIFCAGRTWQPGLAMSEYHRQNVPITQAFFDALGARPGMRVVFTSSLSTIGGSIEPRVYAEESGRDGIREDLLNAYDRAKIACEAIAFSSARRGNPIVILNPGLLLGPGVTPGSNLAAPFQLLWLCQGKLPFYVNGGVTLSDVRDVARAHVSALTRGQVSQRCILGGHNLDRTQYYRRVARLTGLRPPMRLPAWLVTRAMTVTDGLGYLTAGFLAGPVHRSFARTQCLYYFGESHRADEELGYTVTPLETTLLDMLRYYHACGLLPEWLEFLRDLTVDNAPALLILKQLVDQSPYAPFLRRRIKHLHEICESNQALREAFHRLQTASTFDDATGRFRWDAHACRDDLRTLTRFFEYIYFASDEFLREVL